MGGGTVIPGEKIREMATAHNYPIHLLIISDTVISNLNSELFNLRHALIKAGAGGTVFLDTDPKDETRMFEEIGYNIQFVRDFNDITELTLRKAKKLYGVS